MRVNERLDILDGLRGIAILLVVCYHAWLVSGQSFGPLGFIVQSGYLGVDLFFFISGFCLFFPYAKCARDGRPAPSTRRFFERRFLKIVPSYLIALLTFTLIYHAQYGPLPTLVMHLATHLAFVHTLSPATFGTISGPLWTIGVEVQFYLLFPLIVPWFRRSPILGYAVLIAIAESYRLTISGFGLQPSFWWINQLPAFFDVFGAGMFTASIIGGMRAERAWSPRAATVCSGAAFALALTAVIATTVACSPLSDEAARWWLNAHRVLIGPLCAALVVPAYFAAERWRGFVAPSLLVLLSAVSYNLYLWHLEIFVWINNAGLPALATVAIAAPLALGVAGAMTYYFERPILEGDFTFARARALPGVVSAWLARHAPTHVAQARVLPIRVGDFTD